MFIRSLHYHAIKTGKIYLTFLNKFKIALRFCFSRVLVEMIKDGMIQSVLQEDYTGTQTGCGIF